jgi:DDE superfamily endonuclease
LNFQFVISIKTSCLTVHTAGVVIQWKEANLISSLPWPAQSPDLNPIEHVWDQLEKAIRKRNPPKNTNELVSFLMEEWANLDRDYLQKLVDSMPQRAQAVIDSKGNPTKY